MDRIEGYETKPEEFLSVEFTDVAPGYFETMGIPPITTSDRPLPGAGSLIWVNEAFVRRYWPDLNPIGRRVGSWTVDGVVKESRVKKLWEPPMPHLYRQTAQPDARSGVFFIRTVGDPGAVLKQVRAILLSIDPDLDLSRLTTMRDALGETLGSQKFMVALLGLFAGCAVLLAVIGIYGVISYLVNQRTREIGIRMALGARRRQILFAVLRRGGVLTAYGTAAGLLSSWVATRFLESVLFGVSPTDLATFLSVTCVLAMSAVLACLVPARRASRVDPMVALRSE